MKLTDEFKDKTVKRTTELLDIIKTFSKNNNTEEKKDKKVLYSSKLE